MLEAVISNILCNINLKRSSAYFPEEKNLELSSRISVPAISYRSLPAKGDLNTTSEIPNSESSHYQPRVMKIAHPFEKREVHYDQMA